ncbi:MAG TPA: alcohol dehydrogenase catalytic domain-containing protein, partial [Bryobacteraceae bacterium]|nr:alcohol dehydrogenase catalytic domain-containing protein [Bryobacteraceae bacterium]
MKAMVADPIGGPENLKYIDVPTPEPKEGQALVQVEAAGVNFIDVYYRMGLYKTPETPVMLGNEGAGTVVAAGPNAPIAPGTRVAWAMARGAYAEDAT